MEAAQIVVGLARYSSQVERPCVLHDLLVRGNEDKSRRVSSRESRSRGGFLGILWERVEGIGTSNANSPE